MLIAVKAITTPYPRIERHDAEKTFFDPTTKSLEKFPSIDDDPTISLSVVVPAYDEEIRRKAVTISSANAFRQFYLFSPVSVPKMLDECMEYLEKRSTADASFQYEVIVVSDGSRDRTADVANVYSKKYSTNKLRVLELVANRGKGGAVRLVCI